MKKYLHSVLCLLLAVCIVMCFAACDNKNDQTTKAMAGTYKFQEMSRDGVTVTVEDLQEVAEYYELDMDEFCYLTLNEDGTGVLCLMGQAADMVYDDTCIWAVGEEGEKIEYAFENSTFTLEYSGAKLIFKK